MILHINNLVLIIRKYLIRSIYIRQPINNYESHELMTCDIKSIS